MGKRVNKKTRFTVTVNLAEVEGFGSGELLLEIELNHPKVIPTALGSYKKRVVVDLRPFLTETPDDGGENGSLT